jgi:type 1 fimbria pilin
MRRIIATLAAMAMLAFAAAAPALAQEQSGLVNVIIGDVTVQVPVAVAANICDVNVNVIAEQFVGTEDVVCEADADAMAEVPPGFRR